MFLNLEALENGLAHIQESPKDQGALALIVSRPEVDKRQALESAELNITVGLVGDNWQARGFNKTPDGSAHPDMQLNIMNARAAALIAQSKPRWPLAGDQLYVDLDLSTDNLPPGTRLSFGTAIVEITAEPHLGCKKFMERFGRDAVTFVNSKQGKQLNLRGVNAKVVQSGRVQVGSVIHKLKT